MDRNSGAGCHLVAMPYPGRGHINPMMNFCKLLVSKLAYTIKITFVVTEEWLAFVESEPRPPQIQLRSLPNVIPSELVRGSDHSGFFEAVCTKMEAPFEQLLDQVLIENTTPVVQVNAMIIADTLLSWAVSVGSKRNIPLVSLWIMSPTMFLFFHHFDVITQNRHLCDDDVSAEREDELIDYIPGISPTRLADMPKLFGESRHLVAGRIIEAFTSVRKAQCLLLASFDELEPEVNESLRGLLPFPVFSVGPCIPHTQVHENTDDKADNRIVDKADNGIVSSAAANANSNIIINMDYYYLKWLDSQPKSSVLYVSFGSFLSFSREQMDEILAGLRASGVRYLLVSRGDHTSDAREDDEGVLSKSTSLVVPWCDQLRVLCHSSVGGFWTHCGWNSTLEAVFAGVPMLTFPVGLDQFPNRKLIVDDWKVGMRVKSKGLVNREEVKTIVKRFMDTDGDEGIEMRRRANELRERCRRALAKDGSLETNVNAFITDTLQIAHNYQ